MALESVLLALLAVVAIWLVVDAGRERHRLRARMHRALAARRRAAGLPKRGTTAWSHAPLPGAAGADHPRD